MNEAIEQIKRILREMWHRRWIGLAAAWIVALIAIAVVYRIPERYEASARVFVDTDTLLQPLLKGLAVQPNINQQVALVSRTLISRPNVEKVVRMADLDLDVKNDKQRDDLIDDVMKTIQLGSGARGRDNLYTISYRDTEPEKARRVVQSLLTIFVESSLGDKRQDSRAAVRFVDDQIKTYEKALQAAENRLKEFRLRHLGFTEREGLGGDYFARLAGLQTQIAAARLELSSAEQTRDSYKKELAGEVPVAVLEGEPRAVVVAEAVPEIDVRLAKLKGELDQLGRRYTDNHPDVLSTTRLVGELEAQRQQIVDARRKAAEAAAAAAVGGSAPSENPVVQQLRVAMAAVEGQVAAARGKLNGLEQQYAQLKSRATMAPEIESEFSQLNRDYDVQKRTYESLLARRESAVMGIGVQDSGGTQFRVIDPPRVSSNPVAPNRLLLLGGAFLASLVAGFLASLIASQLAPTFHDPGALRESTSRPVLGPVSMLPSPATVAARRRRNLLFAGGSGGLLALFAGVAAFAMLLWRTAA